VRPSLSIRLLRNVDGRCAGIRAGAERDKFNRHRRCSARPKSSRPSRICAVSGFPDT